MICTRMRIMHYWNQYKRSYLLSFTHAKAKWGQKLHCLKTWERSKCSLHYAKPLLRAQWGGGCTYFYGFDQYRSTQKYPDITPEIARLIGQKWRLFLRPEAIMFSLLVLKLNYLNFLIRLPNGVRSNGFWVKIRAPLIFFTIASEAFGDKEWE